MRRNRIYTIHKLKIITLKLCCYLEFVCGEWRLFPLIRKRDRWEMPRTTDYEPVAGPSVMGSARRGEEDNELGDPMPKPKMSDRSMGDKMSTVEEWFEEGPLGIETVVTRLHVSPCHCLNMFLP